MTRRGIYHTPYSLRNLVIGHGVRIGISAHVLEAVVLNAHESWKRCFKGLARKPRLKGQRNRLNSIPFPDAKFHVWPRCRISLLGVGRVRFYKQEIPAGKIKCGRVVKRYSGWYLCLSIDAEPNAIPAIANGKIGIDPGFKDLLALSTGEKVAHPRELEANALRLAQAQRGGNKRLAARVNEHIANQRKDRNHKLTRRLVSENVFIAFSKDRIRNIARRFGKSVASSSHYQIRSMLGYKVNCRTDGLGIYVEPESRNSTRTCSTCGALTGPTGWIGLSVREWDCGACGARHDRDTNSGMNALIAGAGLAHETLVRAA